METGHQIIRPDETDIRSAAERIGRYVNRTPVMTSSMVNRIFQGEFYFKCENFQKVGAFKARGATNAVLSLSSGEIQAGVATHSSGNHAQALSWAASLVDTKAYIVMPSNSPRVKVNAVKDYGGIITFCEPNLAARESTLEQVINRTGAREVHPYNDPVIITGQATAAMELLQQAGDLDIVLAPVGGGGLLSGTALAVHYFCPGARVIACEPEQANDAYLSFTSGKFVASVAPNTIADGLRTSLGSVTFPIIMKYVDEIITVPETSIIRAMQFIWERMKIIIEPSSAVPFAAVMDGKINVKGRRIGIIISGGNVDLADLPWK